MKVHITLYCEIVYSAEKSINLNTNGGWTVYLSEIKERRQKVIWTWQKLWLSVQLEETSWWCSQSQNCSDGNYRSDPETSTICSSSENLFHISKTTDKFLPGLNDIFMAWRVKKVITRTNIFALILISMENLVHKVPVAGDFGKTDHDILEFGIHWESYSLDRYSRL